MRLAAVARVMNEDDIIEAFVRHTLAHVDMMLLLDNGSTDRTVEILGALKTEGLSIAVAQVRTPFFAEEIQNSLLYTTASQVFQPDWVLNLDADEFLDTRAGDLRQQLAGLGPTAQGALLPMVDYFVQGLDMTELVVPRRMRLRGTVDQGTTKCMLRGNLAGKVVLAAGNHWAWIDQVPAVTQDMPGVKLAHYSVRHPITGMVKAALGRLKIHAAGGGPNLVEQRGEHYTHLLDALCGDPAALFADAGRMTKALPPIPLVEDPIDYAGGELRYTTLRDPVMEGIRAVAAAAKLLATSHGRLLDADPAARARLEAEAQDARLLFT